ncbi:MAG: Nif3-like dinuclear metal center hexameric protein [Clostridiales bacterium]|nr:Nif3-like dinuclear metal center hexameric protein [Clostridiales bacterium]
MKLNKITDYILTLFDTTDNKEFHNESGVTFDSKKDIKRIGYCTNLTLHTIEEAKDRNIDLLITHHDAWDFVYGLKEACNEKLKEYQIAHYYNHLPLDDCEFGTNNSLVSKLGLKIIEKSHLEDGFYCGRIAEFENEISMKELVNRLEILLEEPVRAWQFNDKNIKRVGIVCGGGGLSPDVKEAIDKSCDVYITGEKVLYTIEYAEFKKIELDYRKPYLY